MKSAQPPRKRLRLYSRLDARFDDRDEDPRASLVNLVDVMLVFACGLLAALAVPRGQQDPVPGSRQLLGGGEAEAALSPPKPVDKGQSIERPADGMGQAGAGFDRVGEVFRDPKTGQLILVEPGKAHKP